MSIFDNLLGSKSDDNNEHDEKPAEKKVRGKITKLDKEKGYGFISSKSVPFTRIFFHWTSLTQDTLNFLQLEVGMLVDFIPEHDDIKGCRAIKIKVSEDRD